MLTMEEILKDFNAQKNINRSMDLAALLIRFNMTEYDLANISGISIDKIQRALAGADEISEKFYDTLTDRVKELNNLNKITLDIKNPIKETSLSAYRNATTNSFTYSIFSDKEVDLNNNLILNMEKIYTSQSDTGNEKKVKRNSNTQFKTITDDSWGRRVYG
ncbi:hypothetical protein LASA110933_00950 [Latilactobacillus sakei]|uniref:hypothetical protein n=1 Tax=Latilactobacillus sakei TaxID=1599 RepID=UPI000C124BB4|nr:hypothetical protein [Latilactobacillus sakei]SON70935.1 protein of unknown function [Latilactobacillus sakei]